MKDVVRFISLASIFLLIGCGEDPTGPNTEQTVSGPIVNRTGAALLSDARVIVAWVVVSGSDRTEIFGEGTVEDNGQRFRVELTAPPPSSALNNGQFGVGVILITTNQEVGDGDPIDELTEEEILGVAGWYGVIYIGGDVEEIPIDWVSSFQAGYSVGVGVERQGQFDAFEPTAATSVELIVDELANIDIVNWS